MGQFTQARRPLAIEAKSLGPTDKLLLCKIAGSEAVSSLFSYQLEMLAEEKINFSKILRENVKVTLKLPNGTERLIHGVISQFSQGRQLQAGGVTFIRYQAELVPQLWLLTQRWQSRVFQRVRVPDLLQRILGSEWRLPVVQRLTGTYPERSFCVQYRETDFAFVSRLMEEEGIAYWFLDTAEEGGQLVLADNVDSYDALPAPIVYDDNIGGLRTAPCVADWTKTQAVRPGKYLVRDYSFQVPQKNLQADGAALSPVSAGQVQHDFNLQRAGAPDFKTLDYSADFAHHFEGIGKSGQDQKNQLDGLFQENARILRLRLEETAAAALKASGRGDGCHFAAGRRFTLSKHFDADGSYLLTRVDMTASILGAYVTNGPDNLLYENRFECLPAGLPYRPARCTPRPRIDGVQTAVVVGPAGQEIWVDPYGRVKVRFRWDSNQDTPGDDSCWIRVAQVWAGKGWGAFFWPRIGHEVVVAFEEGDPDRPLIVGSVYNNDNMPPVKLPDEQTLAGFRSCIIGGNPATDFNTVIFHDTAGIEYVQVHSNKNEINHCNVTRITAVARQFVFHGLPDE